MSTQIVKRFILPMFDRKKRIGPKIAEEMGSVQVELMLSDQLNDQLQIVRDELNKISESLETEMDLRVKL